MEKVTVTIICAWCKKVMTWGDHPVTDFALRKVSHGICKKCSKALLKEGKE